MHVFQLRFTTTYAAGTDMLGLVFVPTTTSMAESSTTGSNPSLSERRCNKVIYFSGFFC